jgi:hypothetical protein
LAEAGTVQVHRYSAAEIKQISQINVPAVRAEADATAKELRELDALVQAANWTTSLR